MMADQSDRLFVYGTLMPGHGNHRRIADHVRSARPGTVQGILVDLGAFPALIQGEGRVKGILLELAAEALRITDTIESCHPDRDHSLYVREITEVALDDGSIVKAWTYYFGNPDHILDRPRLFAEDADGLPVYSWLAE